MTQTSDNSHPTSALKQLLDDRGIRPSWVASKLGVHKSTVTRWCERRVPSGRVDPLADLLGVEPEIFRPEVVR